MERIKEDPHLTIQQWFDEATLEVVRGAKGPLSPKELIEKVRPLMNDVYQNWRTQQRGLLLGEGLAVLTRRAIWGLVVAGAVSFTPDYKVVIDKSFKREQ